MQRRWWMLYVGAVFAAVCAACLALAFIITVEFRRWATDQRWPLGRIGGVVVSNDAVFVGSWYDGRIYKFDLAGNLLGWTDIHGEPIWIMRRGESIIVHYSGREWPLRDPAFRASHPSGIQATVDDTWWGHPMLKVSRPNQITKVPLQPWYLTIIQSPYPGGLWLPVAFLFVLLAVWVRRLESKVPNVENSRRAKNSIGST